MLGQCLVPSITKKVISYSFTAWKVSEYGVFPDPYFPVLGLNTGIYGPEKTPYLETFHAVVGCGTTAIYSPLNTKFSWSFPIYLKIFRNYFYSNAKKMQIRQKPGKNVDLTKNSLIENYFNKI